jgi:hypothetical protein
MKLEPMDITVVDGLPVTTQTRTIIDLMREDFDLGGVGQVINEFGYENIDFERLRTNAQSLKMHYGLTKKGFIAQIEDFQAQARTVRLQSLGLIDIS